MTHCAHCAAEIITSSQCLSIQPHPTPRLPVLRRQRGRGGWMGMVLAPCSPPASQTPRNRYFSQVQKCLTLQIGDREVLPKPGGMLVFGEIRRHQGKDVSGCRELWSADALPGYPTWREPSWLKAGCSGLALSSQMNLGGLQEQESVHLTQGARHCKVPAGMLLSLWKWSQWLQSVPTS